MADPQTADQGFLAGLLGKFGADPAAAYGGLLSDPATQRQFALRSLGATAQAMAQASMPVPYKGGTPWGSFLGSAGGAAATAGDELIKARLEQAQQQQALATVGLSHQQVELMQAALPGLKSLISTGQDRLGAGGSGTGTAAPGTPAALTGVGAGPRGVQAGGISPTDHYTFLLDNGASKNEATMLTSAANSESSFRPDLTHDHGIGYGLYGHNADRLAAMRTYAGVGPNDPVPWQQQALYALAELRGQVPGLPGGGEPKAGAMVNAATNAQQLTDAQLAFERPDLNIRGGNRAQRLASTTEYLDKPPYAQSPTQTASTGDQPAAPSATPPAADLGPQTASGGAYSVPPPPGPPPKPGEYAIPVRAGNVPLPPAAAPTAPVAPLPGGALPPGAEGAPGPVTGLLGQQPVQVAAAGGVPRIDGGLLAAGGSNLSPAAAVIAQGIARQQAGGGLPPGGAVAGPGAPSEPPAVAPADAAAARAAAMGQEGGGIPGLLQQPPPAGATPTATPYTSAPPVTGQGAPAPGPAPTGPPVAPSLNLPPIPSQMPAMPNLPAVQPTPQQQIAQGVAGLMALSGHPAPPWIDDLAKMPAQMAMEQYKAWVGGQANMMTEQYKKQLEVATAGTISYLQKQGELPADLTKLTTEQNLKLRNELAIRGMEISPTTGRPQFTPDWIEMQGRLKVAEAQANAGFQFVDVPVKDAKGNLGTVKMSGKDAAAYLGNANQSLIPQAPGGAAPGTAPAPGGSPAAPQPAVTPYFSPGQKAQEEAIGTALGEEYKEVGNEARTGFQAKPYLLSIQQAMQTFDNPGAGAQTKLDTLKAIQGTLNGVGIQLTPTLQDWIAKGEVMGKSGTQLGFELAKSLGPRESQMIVQQAIKNNPGIETSATGNRDLTALMGALIDRNQDKLKFYNEYYQNNNHSFMGAQQAFNAWNPPEVMVSKIAPYLLVRPNGDKMSKAEYDKLPAGVTIKQPDGSTFTKPGGAQ